MTKFSFDEVDQRQGILCILQTFLHSGTRRCWMILRHCMTVCVEVWWLHRCCPLTKNDRKPTHLMAQTPWVCEPCDCLVQCTVFYSTSGKIGVAVKITCSTSPTFEAEESTTCFFASEPGNLRQKSARIEYPFRRPASPSSMRSWSPLGWRIRTDQGAKLVLLLTE